MFGGDTDIAKLVHMLKLQQSMHHLVERHASQRIEGDVGKPVVSSLGIEVMVYGKAHRGNDVEVHHI